MLWMFLKKLRMKWYPLIEEIPAHLYTSVYVPTLVIITKVQNPFI